MEQQHQHVTYKSEKREITQLLDLGPHLHPVAELPATSAWISVPLLSASAVGAATGPNGRRRRCGPGTPGAR
jgi:hypothetical protein